MMTCCINKKMYLREFENQLFEIKTKHEIVVAPLREYIEDWLKKALIRITKMENQETWPGSKMQQTIYFQTLVVREEILKIKLPK